MRGWKKIRDFPTTEQNRLRWLVRHANQNGIVKAGAAMRFGHPWYINEAKLPDFLQTQTQQALDKVAAA